MRTIEIQTLLLKANYYKGPLSDILDQATQTAVELLLSRHTSRLPSSSSRWGAKRRAIAAAQIILNFAGFEAGTVDGLSGHNTENAFKAWYYEELTGQKLKVPKVIVPNYSAPKGKFPKQKDCNTFYGNPSKDGVKPHLVTVEMPIKFRIDWNLKQKTNKMTLHKKCAQSALDIFTEALKHYGEDRFRELNLDRYAGAYNHRKMRGGSSWSMHAYACAIDLWAQPNGLHTKSPQAAFSHANYVPFWNIVEGHGWTSLGRAINRDWMHFQAASLR